MAAFSPQALYSSGYGGVEPQPGRYSRAVGRGENKAITIVSIILNWNDSQSTILCAESLLAAGLPEPVERHSILIVDNQSEAGEIEAIENWLSSFSHENISLVINSHNLGFSGGMNRGIARALDMQPAFIWLLNNDTQVDSESIKELVSFCNSRPKLMLVGSTMVEPGENTVQTAGGYRYFKWLGWSRPLLHGSPLEHVGCQAEPRLDYVDGAAMWARTDFLLRSGGLPEDHFLYFEELVLSRKLGPDESIGWCRGSLVYHRGGGSAPTSELQIRSAYYAALSALQYTRLYHPICLPTVVLARVLGISFRALVRRQAGLIIAVLRAIIDFSSGRRR